MRLVATLWCHDLCRKHDPDPRLDAILTRPGGVPKRSNGTGCKPVGHAYAGSNPAPAMTTRGRLREPAAAVFEASRYPAGGAAAGAVGAGSSPPSSPIARTPPKATTADATRPSHAPILMLRSASRPGSLM